MSEPLEEDEPELYLILHKVRGKPAFDIAHKLQIGDEEGWIVSTSGHRAYPTAMWLLQDLADVSDDPIIYPTFTNLDVSEYPDHFTTSRVRASSLASEASDLLSSLGLHAKRILRRI